MLSWKSIQGYICLTHRKTRVQWSIIKSAYSILKQNLPLRQIHSNLRSLPRYFSAAGIQGLFLLSVRWISPFGEHYSETFIEFGV